MMPSYCFRTQVLFLTRLCTPSSLLCSLANPPKLWRDCSGSASVRDHMKTFLQLCADRYYMIGGAFNGDSLLHGSSCPYGPLGMELKKGILDKWWTSVVMTRGQVFGISTMHLTRTASVGKESTLKLVDCSTLECIANQERLNLDQAGDSLRKQLNGSLTVRTNLLQGALEQYLPSLHLVNRRLPFGLAETGVCYQPLERKSDGSGCATEVTQASLVWFCSPRTSSQWLDYWARQRLQWWRKFAVSPSSFSCSDVLDGEEGERASRGVRILYHFPWGAEPLETLRNLGDSELLEMYKGGRGKLQCGDGKKSVVPHVISVCGNMDRGVLAYLQNSLQEVKKTDLKQRVHTRKVLKLHPSLAPIKVALDMGRDSTMDLRQVCEGLHQDLLEGGISTWPGYLKAGPSSLAQLNTMYDEMGVLFTVVLSDSTLESGLVQVRNRDTTIRETMHISELKNFFSKYISGSENI